MGMCVAVCTYPCVSTRNAVLLRRMQRTKPIKAAFTDILNLDLKAFETLLKCAVEGEDATPYQCGSAERLLLRMHRKIVHAQALHAVAESLCAGVYDAVNTVLGDTVGTASQCALPVSDEVNPTTSDMGVKPSNPNTEAKALHRWPDVTVFIEGCSYAVRGGESPPTVTYEWAHSVWAAHSSKTATVYHRHNYEFDALCYHGRPSSGVVEHVVLKPGQSTTGTDGMTICFVARTQKR